MQARWGQWAVSGIRGRTQIIASESAVPLYVVMAGAGLPSTSFLIPTLQVVDGGPAPVMTPRHECVATGDSIIPNEAKGVVREKALRFRHVHPIPSWPTQA